VQNIDAKFRAKSRVGSNGAIDGLPMAAVFIVDTVPYLVV
jgi:hypothetical protein